MEGLGRLRRKKESWPHAHLSIGRHIKRLGNKDCWEAVGPAREAFLNVAAEIKTYLEQNIEPLPCWVTWSIYMVGNKIDTAAPTIIFCSESAKTRQEIKKTIDGSGILARHPGIKTRHMHRAPEFNELIQLAGEAQNWNMSASTAPLVVPNGERLYYLPKGNMMGSQIFAQHGDKLKLATVGGILQSGSSFYFFTAAHPFCDDADADTDSTTFSTSDSELKGSSDSESEESSDEEHDGTSLGSITPDYAKSNPNLDSSDELSPGALGLYHSPDSSSADSDPKKAEMSNREGPTPVIIGRKSRSRSRDLEGRYRQVAKREPDDYDYEPRIREIDRPHSRERDYDDDDREYRRYRFVDRDYYSDDGAIYVRRERDAADYEGDHSPHHKRHLAESSLSGVGAAELLRYSRKSRVSNASSDFNQLVEYGALGYAGAEAIRRENRSRSRNRERRGRRRSRSRSLSQGKTIAGVAALARLGALADARVKRNPESNIVVGDEYIEKARPRSRSRRMSVEESSYRIAQGSLVGAALGGLAKRARSKSLGSRSRSRSRLRQGYPIAAAGLGFAAASALYERARARKQEKEAWSKGLARSRSRSRSVSRSTLRRTASDNPMYSITLEKRHRSRSQSSEQDHDEHISPDLGVRSRRTANFGLFDAPPTLPIGAMPFPEDMLVISTTDSSNPLDYALIRVLLAADGQLVCNRLKVGNSVITVDRFVEVPQHDVRVCTVTASNGYVAGRLLATPSFLRMPGSKKFQRVFTVELEDSVSRGDCGSWVIDHENGGLYGHVIAGSPRSKIVYMIPFVEILTDLERRTGMKLTLPTSLDPARSPGGHPPHGAQEAAAKAVADYEKKTVDKKRLEREMKAYSVLADEEEGQRKAKEEKEKLMHELELFGEMRKTMLKFGFQEDQAQAVLQPKKADRLSLGAVPDQPAITSRAPTYVRVYKDHIDTETLQYFGLAWEWSEDRNYIVILQDLSTLQVDLLFEHTRKLRRDTASILVEDRGHSREGRPEYAFVRRQKGQE